MALKKIFYHSYFHHDGFEIVTKNKIKIVSQIISFDKSSNNAEQGILKEICVERYTYLIH